MQRVIAHYLQREMAILGLIGATISFAAIWAAAIWAIPILAVDTGVWATLTLFLVTTLAGCAATALAIKARQ